MNTRRLRQWGAGLIVAVIALSGASVFGQQVVDSTFVVRVATPAFTEKHPQILIDEAHFNVHTATGGYKPFADLVTSDGCRVAPNTKKFSKESLQGCDILVIANARGAAMRNDPNVDKPAFTDAERDAVRDWVSSGGALLFVADHWPIGSASECLAKRFGVDMSKGRTLDPVNHDPLRPSLSCLAFTRDNGLLLDCPITRGRNDKERINHFTTFTGQSLKGPEGCTVFLKLGDTAYDEVPPSFTQPVSAKGRAQGLAFKYRKGRVVVLGEAACLTAQTTGGGRRAPAGGGAPGAPGMSGPGIRGRRPMNMNARASVTSAVLPAASGPASSPAPAATTNAQAGGGRLAMGMNAPGLDNQQMALNIVHWLAGLLD